MEPKPLADFFAINETSYDRDYKRVIEPFITPNTLIQYLIILPFQLPFEPAATLEIDGGNGFLHSFRFDQMEITQPVWPFSSEEDKITHSTMRTVVNMTVMSEDFIAFPVESDNDLFITEYFEVLLQTLNQLIIAYIVQHKDTGVFRITRTNVQFMVPYLVTHLPDWVNSIGGVFLAHTNLDAPRELLIKDQLLIVLKHMVQIQERVNPFYLSEELAVTATRHLRIGALREAVIEAQASVETMLTTLYYRFLLYEGASEERAERTLQATPFASLVKRELHARMGGRWDIKDNTSPVGQYWKETYERRGRIVHGGYFPNETEARESVTSAQEMRAYVVERLRANKKAYPEIYALFDPAPRQK